MSNFIPMVYAVLKDKGIDTKGMTTDEAVEKYNELTGKSGTYNTDSGEEKEKAEKQDIQKLLGKEYKGYKGQDAINKLLAEKQGHIKSAFTRTDIGSIDLIWGNDKAGLKHIIIRREEQGINVDKFLSNLAEVIENGKYIKKMIGVDMSFFTMGK